jgi:hypothetical protein
VKTALQKRRRRRRRTYSKEPILPSLTEVTLHLEKSIHLICKPIYFGKGFIRKKVVPMLL